MSKFIPLHNYEYKVTWYTSTSTRFWAHIYFDLALQASQLQVPERPVGSPQLHRFQAVRIPFVHPHLSAPRELPVVPHQSPRTVDVEAEEVLRPA